MNENISRLMDGEVDAQEFDRICGEMKAPAAMSTWVCYHVIGDQLRGAHGVSTGFSTRFCAALAAEPTVLAPAAPRARSTQVATAAWAVAATLAAVTAQGKPLPDLPADYLIAHQEYSPSTAIQGMGPYMRAVAVTGNEPRP